MKKLVMSLTAVLLAAGLAAAQDTGGDKAASGVGKHKTQPPDPLVKTATHKKGHKGGKGTKKGGKKSTDSTAGTQARPGVPPPTRPTDPK